LEYIAFAGPVQSRFWTVLTRPDRVVARPKT
jgi:hypothetical protein